MRNRLVITLALGVLVAVLGAGVVTAQVSGGGSGVSVELPGKLPKLICDSDGDGIPDSVDPDCDAVPEPPPKPPPTTPTTPEPEVPAPPVDPGGGGSGGGDGGGAPTTPVDPGGGGNGGGGSGGGDKGKDGPKNTPGTDGPFDRDKGKGKDEGSKADKEDDRAPLEKPEIRRPDGAPSNSNPSVSLTSPGAAPVGVPNFIIDQFTIPPFLLPIYQACGTEYGIPWEVLASINRIETAFGTNLNVSTAGALGWMQFMPPTWEAYGVDANNDGRKDPYNPVDAICAAANYLDASGYEDDAYNAIFAYNHADWYVDEVLLYARQYGDLPGGLVDSLTGLTEGAHFPVAAKARYADDISEREALARSTPKQGGSGNVADVVADSPTRRGIDIFAKRGAPVVAVNDGVITRIGKNRKLGKFVVLRDAYGNEYTYAGLGSIADAVPAPKREPLSDRDFDLVTPGEGKDKPTRQASGLTRKAAKQVHREAGGGNGKDSKSSGGRAEDRPVNTENMRERMFALPERPANLEQADLTGQLDSLLGEGMPGYETFKAYFSGVLRFDPKTMEARPLRRGSRVVGGTVLGKIGSPGDDYAPRVHFEIEPAGRGSRTIDPKPILDGWKLLEATAIYRAQGKDPFSDRATIGQVLLASKSQLVRQVLADPMIEIYACGRQDIATGVIDRRILASLAYLAQRGFRLTVTSLTCGRSTAYTSSGNVSAHSTGDAVDIAQVNGLPILGNQGRGSITEAVIQELLKLQGTMAPAQIISLMEMGGPTFAMGDHADHIHLGYTPDGAPQGGRPLGGLLAPDQWDKLLDRIADLDQPTVPLKPSKFSLRANGKRASNAHIGE